MDRLIPLTKGQFAIVDDEDFETLNQFKWHAAWSKFTQSYYASRNVKDENGKYVGSISMHRQILGLDLSDGRRGDHVKIGETLNNCRENLRIATAQENAQNRRLRSDNGSGFKGVTWYPSMKRWRVRISLGGKSSKSLGLYPEDQKIEAARVYDRAAIQYHGKFAGLNFPREDYVNG